MSKLLLKLSSKFFISIIGVFLYQLYMALLLSDWSFFENFCSVILGIPILFKHIKHSSFILCEYEFYYWQTLWFSFVVCCFHPFTTVCLFHIFMMDYKLILFGHNLVTEQQHFRNLSLRVLEAWVSSVFLKKCFCVFFFFVVFSRCLGDNSLSMFSHFCTISVSEIRTLVNFIKG